jgi:ribose 5-phosphate isomerase A
LSDPHLAQKRAVAESAAARVWEGCRLGLGSGSTSELFVQAVGVRVRAGLRLVGVPSSERVAGLAEQAGLVLEDLDERPLDLCVDGADEVDPQLRLIKGAGGALVRERIVAAAAKKLLILVDESKLVQRLGQRYKLPVEIQRFGYRRTQARVAALLGGAELRLRDGSPVMTDNGAHLVDCPLDGTSSPEEIELALRAIAGVVDCGLFIGFSPEVLVGRADRVESLSLPR